MLAARLLMMAAAGRNRATQPLWNSADKDADIALSNGDLTATSSNAGSVRSTNSKSTGKWYVEFTADTNATGAQEWRVGIANSSHTITQIVGNNANGWAFCGDGEKNTNSSGSAYGNSITDGDVIGLALDMDNGRLFFAINNTWQNSGDPAAGTNAAFTSLSGAMFLAWGSNNATRAVSLKSVSAYSYTPPTGFTAGW